ncbi:MSCRAMM family protein [Facklamia sp. P13055]|uniref:MSCRAMM family protein n=1 Tax=Facklamia sp. P13055 TaxID=3421952 RepID=UPI003D164DC3
MKLFKQLTTFLLMLFTLMIIPFNHISATSNRLIIHSVDSETIREYRVWKVDPTYSQADIASLKEKKVSELDHLFKQSYSSKTNENSLAIIDGLPDGSYYGLEINQAGKKEERTVPFIIDLPYQNAFEVDVFPKRVQTGYLKIKVIGEVTTNQMDDWKNLANVTFYIYAANSDQPMLFKEGHFTTDPSGKAELKSNSLGEITLASLPEGDYVLVELKTVDGYQLSKKIHFTIKAGEVTEVLVKNYLIAKETSQDSTTEPTDESSFEEGLEKGGQHFRKVNHKKPAQGLMGARFEVVTWNSKKRLFEPVSSKEGSFYIVESDSRGYFEVNNLPLGKYYLIEIEAPIVQGLKYQPFEQAIPFEITSQSYWNYTVMEIVNHPVEASKQEQDIPINRPAKPSDIGFLPTTGECKTKYFYLAFLFITIGLFILFYKSTTGTERISCKLYEEEKN